MTIRRNIVCLIALLWAGSCSTSAALERSQEFLANGYPYQAWLEVDAERTRLLAEGLTVGDDLEQQWRDLRYRYLVDAAREAIYADAEARGVEMARGALELRPGDEAAEELILRAHRKMALRATNTGQLQLARTEFKEALASFQEALSYVDGFKPAMEGIESVKESVSRLHREAQEQFLEAIRKMPQFRYPEVDWHAAAALTRDPSRDDAQEVKEQAQHELALEAQERAESAKGDRGYGAALMEYRTARELWPQMPGVDDYIAQMEKEVQAVQKTEAAQLAIQADRLDDARKLLDEAQELSTLEGATINELRLAARRRAGTLAYDAARDLELQGDKQEALTAFERLAVDWPDGLLDEQTRIGALRSDITAAEQAYAEGDAAVGRGELEAALDQFRTARTYYEKYRDTAARIDALEKKLAERGGGS